MMDIIVSRVYDISRFKHFICLKYAYSQSYGEVIINSINTHGPIKFYKLSECEIRYLIREKICTLKITNMEEELLKHQKRTLQEARKDANKKTMEEISDSYITYKVRYTKLISFNEELTRRQIKDLIDNPCVKSINVEKLGNY